MGASQHQDSVLFNERDFWQHPRTFEFLRKGDCEDHALWAWRKLVELRLHARFVVGSWREGASGGSGGHAWVVYQADGVEYLLEATTKGAHPMITELAESKERYIPHYSVGPSYRTTAYRGYLLDLKRSRAGARATEET